MECTLREVLWQMRGVEAQQWRVQKRHRGAGLSQCVVGLSDAWWQQKIHQKQENWHGGGAAHQGTGSQEGLSQDVIRQTGLQL